MAAAQAQLFEDDFPLVRSCPLLNELRLTEEIEDLIINVKDNAWVHAHRIILAARIPTLRRTLSGPRRQENTVLSWPTVTLSTASALLEYVYTGQARITEANVRGIVALAKMVDVVKLADWGVTFMTNSLNLDNLANTWDCAQSLKIEPLMAACINLMKTHFEGIICSDLFVRLPANTMLTLLRDDNLSVSSEEAVFAAIACWVGPGSEDHNERLKLHAPVMLKEVRWLQTSIQFRNRLMASHEIFNESRDCLRFLGLVEQWMQFEAENKPPCPFNQNRRSSIRKLLVFGEDKNEYGRWSVLGFNSDLQQEERIADMEGHWYASYSVIGESIFMVGGQKPGSSRVFEFLPRERHWRERAPLAAKRDSHAATIVQAGGAGEMLLGVFGGYVDGVTSLSTCEVYDVSQDRWYKLPDMQEKRIGPAAACLPDDSRVFVFGGGKKYSSWLASVEFCQLGADWQERATTASSTDFWETAMPMRTARWGLAATPFRGRILVAGGYDGSDLNVVEMFLLPDANSPRGQWTELAPMKQPRSWFTLLTSADAVFALGNESAPSNTVEALIPPDGAAAYTNDLTSWTWSIKSPIETLERIWGAAFLRM